MAQVIETERGDYEKFLKQLPIELRTKALGQAARAGGNVVKTRARQLVPIGDPNHKPDNKPLRDTIIVKIAWYEQDQVVVALVGPSNNGGQHGHLVEHGHNIRARGKKDAGPGDFTGARVEGKEFMAPAADQTEAEQRAAVISKIQKVVEKHRIG